MNQKEEGSVWSLESFHPGGVESLSFCLNGWIELSHMGTCGVFMCLSRCENDALVTYPM